MNTMNKHRHHKPQTTTNTNTELIESSSNHHDIPYRFMPLFPPLISPLSYHIYPSSYAQPQPPCASITPAVHQLTTTNHHTTSPSIPHLSANLVYTDPKQKLTPKQSKPPKSTAHQLTKNHLSRPQHSLSPTA
jgi:hypothetical protein